MRFSILFSVFSVESRTAKKMGWVEQFMSSSEDCGMEIWAPDKKSGFIETTHYYIKEGEERLRCKWQISTSCDRVQWMFDKFDFHDKTGSYYDSIFTEISESQSAENSEKIFNCLSDNVKVSYGQKLTKKFCAFDDANDYDDEDFNKLYDDPTGGPVMSWSTITTPEFEIDYQTKHLIYGFKINWRCLDFENTENSDKL